MTTNQQPQPVQKSQRKETKIDNYISRFSCIFLAIKVIFSKLFTYIAFIFCYAVLFVLSIILCITCIFITEKLFLKLFFSLINNPLKALQNLKK